LLLDKAAPKDQQHARACRSYFSITQLRSTLAPFEYSTIGI
jgi:hypothetical protein